MKLDHTVLPLPASHFAYLKLILWVVTLGRKSAPLSICSHTNLIHQDLYSLFIAYWQLLSKVDVFLVS